MDQLDLNRACELAFLVAREGVEQEPPIEPPGPMRMFLYVRHFPQRAISIARQVLAEDETFRRRVEAAATEENVGEGAMRWLSLPGVLSLDAEQVTRHDSPDDGEPVDEPEAAQVGEESIRSEIDELKNLVGQLAEEKNAIDDEVSGLEQRLAEPAQDQVATPTSAEPSEGSAVLSPGASLAAQVRSLHTDLKQARADRDQAQEAKELAIIEQAELTEELDELRRVAAEAQGRLDELESAVAQTSSEVEAVGSEAALAKQERDQAIAESQEVAAERDSIAAEVQRLETELTAAQAGVTSSESELEAAIAARTALTDHVDALTGAHTAARVEMERINAALAERGASDSEKIEALDAALTDFTVERDTLTSKLELVRTTVAALQDQMTTLDSSVTEAETVADALGERMQQLRSSVEDLKAEPIAAADMSALDVPDAFDMSGFVEVSVGEDETEDAGESSGNGDGPVASVSEAPQAELQADEPSESDDEVAGDAPAAPVDEGEGDDTPPSEPESTESAEEPEDIDEVHALVAEAVASFEPGTDDALPGSEVTGAEATPSTETTTRSRGRGGLASLFSSFTHSSTPEKTETAEASGPLLATAGVVGAGAAVLESVEAEAETDEPTSAKEAAPSSRQPIDIPEEILDDPVAVARHVVNTENAVLLIDGDPVAAMGWPSVDRVDQRRNLVHYLSALAASSGAAPDVLLDRDHGHDRLPDSRSVRVRLTREGGSVAAQITSLIDSYPSEWPVVVVTDDMDLASSSAMKGATMIDNGQLLDLFIAT